jgi:hypothetical protein
MAFRRRLSQPFSANHQLMNSLVSKRRPTGFTIDVEDTRMAPQLSPLLENFQVAPGYALRAKVSGQEVTRNIPCAILSAPLPWNG